MILRPHRVLIVERGRSSSVLVGGDRSLFPSERDAAIPACLSLWPVDLSPMVSYSVKSKAPLHLGQ
jgi:hypothetical protein